MNLSSFPCRGTLYHELTPLASLQRAGQLKPKNNKPQVY